MSLRTAITLVTAFSASVLHADEGMMRVHASGYEVLLDDPSCNGPYQRLIRATLVAPNLLDEIEASPVCESRERKGAELTVRTFPCEQVNAPTRALENGLLATDTISLYATVEICQGVWDTSVRMVSAELNGSIGGVAFDPAHLKEFSSGFQQFNFEEDAGRLSFSINCLDNRITAESSPLSFEAFFQLHEFGSAGCNPSSCFDVVEMPKTNYWEQVEVRARCDAPAGEVSP